MSSIDYTQTAESLVEELADEGIDADAGAVADDLQEAMEKFDLPQDQAVRTVVNNRTPTDAEVSPMASSGGEQVDIASIGELHENADGEAAWVEVVGEVVSTWNVGHDSIAQKAEIGDETGRTQVTVWASADAPSLEEGDVVRLGNVPTDEYQGDYSVKVTSNSEIESVDEDVDPADNMHEVSGRVVAAYDGLIERCGQEDCSRTLGDNDQCAEHGEVEGEHDLRLKLSVDDGANVHNVTLHREEVEALFDTTLAEQKQVAMDALDEDKPGEDMGAELMGRQLVAEGPELYNAIHADSVAVISDISQSEVEASLVEAREARAEIGN